MLEYGASRLSRERNAYVKGRERLDTSGDEGGFWATSLEVPGTNGQGETKEECLENLAGAVGLILEVNEEEAITAKYFAAGEPDRPDLAPTKVNVDFPKWMVQALDRAAGNLGVPRQSLIKMWLAERLERAS